MVIHKVLAPQASLISEHVLTLSRTPCEASEASKGHDETRHKALYVIAANLRGLTFHGPRRSF